MTPQFGSVSFILLQQKHRQAVICMLRNRKDRFDLDSPVSTEDELWEDVAIDFNNMLYIVSNPKLEWYDRLEGRDGWDPNNPAIFLQKRDAAWLKGTYADYFKKKYKRFLNKWNKETGGGDGSPPSSQNYLDAHDQWISWVFCHDYDNGFLLSSNICSKMPKGFQSEGGFEDAPDTTPTKKASKWEELLEDNREKQKGVMQMISEATASISSNKTMMGTPDVVTFDYCQSRVKKHREMKKELSDASDSDEELIEEQKKMFKSRRKLWMNRASQVDKNGPMKKEFFNP